LRLRWEEDRLANSTDEQTVITSTANAY
jgi:hypothetical protein